MSLALVVPGMENHAILTVTLFTQYLSIKQNIKHTKIDRHRRLKMLLTNWTRRTWINSSSYIGTCHQLVLTRETQWCQYHFSMFFLVNKLYTKNHIHEIWNFFSLTTSTDHVVDLTSTWLCPACVNGCGCRICSWYGYVCLVFFFVSIYLRIQNTWLYIPTKVMRCCKFFIMLTLLRYRHVPKGTPVL